MTIEVAVFPERVIVKTIGIAQVLAAVRIGRADRDHRGRLSDGDGLGAVVTLPEASVAV